MTPQTDVLSPLARQPLRQADAELLLTLRLQALQSFAQCRIPGFIELGRQLRQTRQRPGAALEQLVTGKVCRSRHNTSHLRWPCMPGARAREIHHLAPLVFGQPPACALHVAVVQGFALLLTFEQQAQHHQQQSAPLGIGSRRQCRGCDRPYSQLGAQQHDRPGQIDPHQKQRHCGEGAVKSGDNRETAAHTRPNSALATSNSTGAEQAAQQAWTKGTRVLGTAAQQQGKGCDAR